jgi:hypothetical protein
VQVIAASPRGISAPIAGIALATANALTPTATDLVHLTHAPLICLFYHHPAPDLIAKLSAQL